MVSRPPLPTATKEHRIFFKTWNNNVRIWITATNGSVWPNAVMQLMHAKKTAANEFTNNSFLAPSFTEFFWFYRAFQLVYRFWLWDVTNFNAKLFDPCQILNISKKIGRLWRAFGFLQNIHIFMEFFCPSLIFSHFKLFSAQHFFDTFFIQSSI